MDGVTSLIPPAWPYFDSLGLFPGAIPGLSSPLTLSQASARSSGSNENNELWEQSSQAPAESLLPTKMGKSRVGMPAFRVPESLIVYKRGYHHAEDQDDRQLVDEPQFQ